ncbi:hypothetical protein [Burkholderia ambifaria]
MEAWRTDYNSVRPHRCLGATGAGPIPATAST